MMPLNNLLNVFVPILPFLAITGFENKLSTKIASFLAITMFLNLVIVKNELLSGIG